MPLGRRSLLAAVLCLSALLPCVAPHADAQDTVSDLSAGPASGTFRFASATPKTLAELMKQPGPDGSTTVVGHLFMPKVADGQKVPAVVLIHGSGGVYKAMLDFWPKQFNAAGIAVFSVDSFGPRGVRSTVEDQAQVPFAADTADAFAALRLLATHPRIDASRVAVMGFSRGGITAFRSALERVASSQNLPGGLRFAAHVPVYSGGCVGVFRVTVRPGTYGKAPMMWVHGDADDYTPIGPCRDYAALIEKAGTPVQFVTVQGAHHKFDEDDPRRIHVAGAQRMLEACPLEFDIEKGIFIDRFTGQRIAGEQVAAVNKQACSARGANVEGNPRLRARAAEAIVGFLATTFSR
jgi:dienelactone hydrolase